MMNKKGVRTHESTLKESFVFGRASVYSSMCFFGYGRVLKIKNNATILRGRRGVGRGRGRRHLKYFFF